MPVERSPANYNVHLRPLYLKWAAESFRKGNAAEGMGFFQHVYGSPRDMEHKESINSCGK